MHVSNGPYSENLSSVSDVAEFVGVATDTWLELEIELCSKEKSQQRKSVSTKQGDEKGSGHFGP
jgi:hypothetical protein